METESQKQTKQRQQQKKSNPNRNSWSWNVWTEVLHLLPLFPVLVHRRDLKVVGIASSQADLSLFYSLMLWAVLFCGFKPITFRELGAGRPRKLQPTVVSCFLHAIQWDFANGLWVKRAQPHQNVHLFQECFLTCFATPRSLRGAREAHSSLNPLSFLPWQWHKPPAATQESNLNLTSNLPDAEWQIRICWAWIFFFLSAQKIN